MRRVRLANASLVARIGARGASIPVGVILVEYNTRRVRLANASLVARIGARGASIPVGVILGRSHSTYYYGSLAQLVRATGS